MLFFDADGMVSGTREYVFAEWGATAKDDMAAQRSQFDSTKDGRLTALGAEWARFKVRGAPTFVSATAAHTLAAGLRRGLLPMHFRCIGRENRCPSPASTSVFQSWGLSRKPEPL